MADEKQDTPRPFDVKTVEYLLRLMTDHELSEVDLKEGDQRIRLRKGPIGVPLGWTSGNHDGSIPVSAIRSADQPPVATSYVAQVPASLQSTTGRPLSSSA